MRGWFVSLKCSGQFLLLLLSGLNSDNKKLLPTKYKILEPVHQ